LNDYWPAITHGECSENLNKEEKKKETNDDEKVKTRSKRRHRSNSIQVKMYAI